MFFFGCSLKKRESQSGNLIKMRNFFFGPHSFHFENGCNIASMFVLCLQFSGRNETSFMFPFFFFFFFFFLLLTFNSGFNSLISIPTLFFLVTEAFTHLHASYSYTHFILTDTLVITCLKLFA